MATLVVRDSQYHTHIEARATQSCKKQDNNPSTIPEILRYLRERQCSGEGRQLLYWKFPQHRQAIRVTLPLS